MPGFQGGERTRRPAVSASACAIGASALRLTPACLEARSRNYVALPGRLEDSRASRSVQVRVLDRSLVGLFQIHADSSLDGQRQRCVGQRSAGDQGSAQMARMRPPGRCGSPTR